MNDNDYGNFAVGTAKTIVMEEIDRIEREFKDDIQALLDAWTIRISKRINERMEVVGIGQALEIDADWDVKNSPTFKIKATTVVGKEIDEQDL